MTIQDKETDALFLLLLKFKQKKEIIMAVDCLLTKEEQRYQMMMWLYNQMNTPPNTTEILNKAMKIEETIR